MVESRITAASRTHVGLVRRVNEDALYAQHPVYIVADGMGGHDAGDIASRLTVEAFAETIPSDTYAKYDDISAGFARAVQTVGEVSLASENGAGTTLSGIFMVEQRGFPYWLVINVGDSRVYEVHGGEVTQITRDHTLRDETLAQGADPNDPDLPGRNVITRAIGSHSDRPEFRLLPVRSQSRLVICTDGVCGELSDAAFASIVRAGADAAETADLLIAEALEYGGSDNATVIVVDVDEFPEGAEVVALAEEEPVDTLDITRPVPRIEGSIAA